MLLNIENSLETKSTFPSSARLCLIITFAQSGSRGLCRPSSTAISSTTTSSRAHPSTITLIVNRCEKEAWRDCWLFACANASGWMCSRSRVSDTSCSRRSFRVCSSMQVEEQREAEAAQLDAHAKGRDPGCMRGRAGQRAEVGVYSAPSDTGKLGNLLCLLCERVACSGFAILRRCAARNVSQAPHHRACLHAALHEALHDSGCPPPLRAVGN